jgi:hypothetical protein
MLEVREALVLGAKLFTGVIHDWLVESRRR